MEVRRIAGALGAEISGVDLCSLEDNAVKRIRQALLDNLVVFFRDQDLDPAAFLAFATHFGKPVEYPFVKGLDGFPEMIQVLKREEERINFGGIWHTDTSYLEKPPMGTVLLSPEVPPYGGDTLFANQVAAYEALSDGLKQTLERLRAVNTSAIADASRTREDRIKDRLRKQRPMPGHWREYKADLTPSSMKSQPSGRLWQSIHGKRHGRRN
jgi:taurine dioxygenase